MHDFVFTFLLFSLGPYCRVVFVLVKILRRTVGHCWNHFLTRLATPCPFILRVPPLLFCMFLFCFCSLVFVVLLVFFVYSIYLASCLVDSIGNMQKRFTALDGCRFPFVFFLIAARRHTLHGQKTDHTNIYQVKPYTSDFDVTGIFMPFGVKVIFWGG